MLHTPVTATDSRGEARERILDERCHLSESVLWDLQRSFFECRGVDAWCSGGVPSYVTTNPYIARAYARVVAAFLRDCRPTDPTRPIYIVELGAGSGRFAFHFVRTLATIAARTALEVPFTYVMTDFTEEILSFWRSHPCLQPLVDEGLVDFARFDAAAPAPIELEHRGVVLTDAIATPIVAIANYVFDSIPAEVYTVVDGRVRQTLVTISEPTPEPEPAATDMPDQLAISLEIACPEGDAAADGPWAPLLDTYRDLPSGTTLLIPVSALGVIRHLHDLSRGRLLFLVGDRGDDGAVGVIGQEGLGLLTHGSVSLPVNYDAIARFVRNSGGTVLDTEGGHASLRVSGYVFGSADATRGAAEAFAQSIEETGPDDFYRLKTVVDQAADDLAIDQILSLLRFGDWDTKLFLTTLPSFLRSVPALAEAQHGTVYEALQHVWAHYYPLPGDVDVAFCIATLLSGIGRHRDALEFVQHSLRLHGTDPATLYLGGVCHRELGDLEAAILSFDEALTLETDHDLSGEIRTQLQACST